MKAQKWLKNLVMAIFSTITSYSTLNNVIRANEWYLAILWYHLWCSSNSRPYRITLCAMIATQMATKMANNCQKSCFVAKFTSITSHSTNNIVVWGNYLHVFLILIKKLSVNFHHSESKQDQLAYANVWMAEFFSFPVLISWIWAH
jgi:hypothetical protein